MAGKVKAQKLQKLRLFSLHAAPAATKTWYARPEFLLGAHAEFQAMGWLTLADTACPCLEDGLTKAPVEQTTPSSAPWSLHACQIITLGAGVEFSGRGCLGWAWARATVSFRGKISNPRAMPHD